MLGWSVLQRRRQTPEALEAEQVSSAHPPQGTWLPMETAAGVWKLLTQLLRTARGCACMQQFSFPTAGLSCVLQQLCSVLQRRKPTSSWKAELCYRETERKRCVKRPTVENKGYSQTLAPREQKQQRHRGADESRYRSSVKTTTWGIYLERLSQAVAGSTQALFNWTAFPTGDLPAVTGLRRCSPILYSNYTWWCLGVQFSDTENCDCTFTVHKLCVLFF